MSYNFIEGLNVINDSKKPIKSAWDLSTKHLKLENKFDKIIEVICDYENLFISKNKFHNQYHLAHVIWSSAWLLSEETIDFDFDSHALILLIAANFHDVEHTGKGNKHAFEIEKISAEFFRQWWNNNSLFVEKITAIDSNIIGDTIYNLIIYTDLEQGHKIVNDNYQKNPKYFCNGVYINKLSKILNEADLFLNTLPHTVYSYNSALMDESKKTIDEQTKWVLINNFLTIITHSFTSEAAQKLGIQQNIKQLNSLISQNINQHHTIQEKIENQFSKS